MDTYHTNVRKVLQITKNLAEALRHLQHQDRPRLIWIDAICINQDDLEERSAEVSEMGSIYHNAREVIVWLGPADLNSKLALKTLNRIGSSVQYDKSDNTVSTTPGSWPASLGKDPEAMQSNKNCWLAIRDLLNRDWFYRLWVFQEIVLARNARVVVGYNTIDWEPFIGALRWVGTKSARLEQYFHNLRHSCRDIIFRLEEGCGSEVNVWHALDYSQTLDCSDQRDKLYGIRSILGDFYSGLIIADYSQSMERVYINFAKKWLAKGQELNFMNFCNVPLHLRTPSLPSWVPDFSRAATTTRFVRSECAGKSRAFASINDQDQLRLQGVLIGRITFVSSPATQTANNVTECCKEWLEIVTNSQNLEGESMSEASFLGTIAGGHNRETFPNSKVWRPTTADISAFLAGQKVKNDHILESRIRDAVVGRSLFRTSEGIFGLAPDGAKPGDSIAVMLGYENPVVLRPVVGLSEKHFQLLGACYLSSYMDGEALLGPLPSGWSARWEYVGDEKDLVMMYTNGSILTQQDPRMELPPDWRYVYGDKDNAEEVREIANMTEQYFENMKTGEVTKFDPRLTPALLKERGVAIEELIIV